MITIKVKGKRFILDNVCSYHRVPGTNDVMLNWPAVAVTELHNQYYQERLGFGENHIECDEFLAFLDRLTGARSFPPLDKKEPVKKDEDVSGKWRKNVRKDLLGQANKHMEEKNETP